MLSNKYLLLKFGFDTADNEPCKVCPLSAYRSPRYFGAHESDFSRSALEDALVKVCEAGVDAFIIKATHLAWSMGQKIVRGWQKTCMKAGLHDEIAVLANFIEGSVLALRNTDPDMQHLAESLKPGVII